MNVPVTRLHISPLSPDLLTAILGLEISKLATNVSYHSLQVFPESGYGYVDLPKMEAEKVRKKINGSILKGKKVKVEEARPKKRKHVDKGTEVLSQDEHDNDSQPMRRKRSKHETEVIPGYELPEKRKIKRGWTEPKAELTKKRRKDKSDSATKPQISSKYTDKEELLFKTKIPENRSSTQKKRAQTKTTTGNSEVVHEFKKSTTTPSFLRNDKMIDDKIVNYEDGKGWVDEQGAVVEKEGVRASKRRKAAMNGIENEVIAAQLTKSPQQTNQKANMALRQQSSSESSNNNHSRSSSEMSDRANVDPIAATSRMDTDGEETSTSGSSAPDTSTEDSNDSTSDGGSTDSTQEVGKVTPPRSVVHPLEALFKKPTKPASSQTLTISQDNIKPSLEIQTSFSFFDQQHDDEDIPAMPMTPFSSQDLRSRGTRSAAPTPDTAHPSRMSSLFNSDESEGELSEMEEGMGDSQLGSSTQPSSLQSQSLQVPQTDFEKQFWEKRGENNRAWKARRRAVLKEKRQRDNRARRPKNW